MKSMISIDATHPSSGQVLVQSPSAAYQTFPQASAGPAVLIVTVPIGILMAIVLLGELAHVQGMSRAVWATQQRGSRQLMTRRTAMNT